MDRGETVWWVRGIKRGDAFLGHDWAPDLLGLLLVPVTTAIELLVLSRVHTWKVGVVRYRPDRFGGRYEIVQKERLAKREDPVPHIARLVADVEAGRFDTG